MSSRATPDGHTTAADVGASLDPCRALGEALARLGLGATVERRGAAAFVTLDDRRALARVADDTVRRAVVAAGRALGFTQVALMLGDG